MKEFVILFCFTEMTVRLVELWLTAQMGQCLLGAMDSGKILNGLIVS